MSAAANLRVAAAFERIADLLFQQNGEAHRIAAYRRAAGSLRATERDVADIVRDRGTPGLTRLRAIGPALASEIYELVTTGRLRLLERLEERAAPKKMLERMPGIGPTLARRIRDQLGVETLEDLEAAAHDGRLEGIHGVGRERVEQAKRAIAELLTHTTPSEEAMPPVAMLLDLDVRYRRLAAGHRLRRIAPHRFNPHHRKWLPVLQYSEGGWRFDVMFSNSAQAHRLNRTHDWVVLHYERKGSRGQCTVVTEYRGADRGKRVIRGREDACREHYAAQPKPRFEMPECLMA